MCFTSFFALGVQYCLPILKTEKDRQALRDAVKSGNPKVLYAGGSGGLFSCLCEMLFHPDCFTQTVSPRLVGNIVIVVSLSCIMLPCLQFFMGTDSAPHPKHRKEAGNGGTESVRVRE